MKRFFGLFAFLCTAFVSQISQADLTYTSGQITENFDSLSSTGSAATSNTFALNGWSLYNAAGASITTYAAQNGSGNTGAFTSLGSTGSSERALGSVASGGAYFGSPASGALAGYFAVAIKNGTLGSFKDFTVTYDGEQWRNGGNTNAQSLTVSYGFGNTFGTVASWTNVAALNFTSPVTGAAAAALDGNVAPNRTAGITSTVTDNWATGQTLWVRWADLNDTGNDHGLAVDNFSFSAHVATVPEPTSMLLASIAGVSGGYGAWRRRKAKNG